MPLWNASIPYKLFVNGQRIILHALIETNYLSFYLGFMIPYATPTQMPYPLLVGGTNASSTTRYSTSVRCFFKGQRHLRDIGGTWIQLDNWPESCYVGASADSTDRDWDTLQRRQIRDLGGGCFSIPCVLFPFITTWSSVTPDESGQTFGEFDGVLFITGFNNAAENTITDNTTGKTYFVTRSSQSTGLLAYAAIEEA